MADTHKGIHEEFEVTLKVKVTLTQASYYGTRTSDQLRTEMESAKKAMHDELMYKLSGSWRADRLGENKWGYVDYLYDVEPIKQNP